VREALDLGLLLAERARDAPVLVAHLRELRGDLAGQLDALLDRRVRVERLALDLVEQVRPPAEKLVVRELPRLRIG
jgi:hypothetical protein